MERFGELSHPEGQIVGFKVFLQMATRSIHSGGLLEALVLRVCTQIPLFIYLPGLIHCSECRPLCSRQCSGPDTHVSNGICVYPRTAVASVQLVVHLYKLLVPNCTIRLSFPGRKILMNVHCIASCSRVRKA